jgi:hypothetical protein
MPVTLLDRLLHPTFGSKLEFIAKEMCDRKVFSDPVKYTKNRITIQAYLMGSPRILIDDVKVYDPIGKLFGWTGVPPACKAKILSEVWLMYEEAVEHRLQRYSDRYAEQVAYMEKVKDVCKSKYEE